MDIKIVKQEKLDEGNRLRATVGIPKADKDRLTQEALEALAQQLGLDKEKNPDLKQAFIDGAGEEAVNNMVGNYLAQKAAPSIIRQLDLHTMFNPEPAYDCDVDVLGDGDCELPIDLILKPSYELRSYEPLTVDVPEGAVTDETVEDQINQVMDRYADYELASGEVLEQGDCGKADLETTLNGEVLPGLTGKDHLLHLEPGLMPDGFTNSIIGMKVGETKEFDFEAPKGDPDDPDATETLHTKVTINDKRRRVVPGLTDAFVKEHFPDKGSTADAYRASLKADMQRDMDARMKDQRDVLVDQELSQRLDGTIPDLYYEHAQRDLLGNLQQQLEYQKMTLDQYIQQQGMDQNQFQMMLMMQAMNTLRSGLALDALYRHINDPITDEDVKAALHEMAPGYEKQAREEMQQNDTMFVAREIAERLKAHKWAMDHATFTTD